MFDPVYNTVKPLNSGHLRGLKKFSVTGNFPLLGGNLTKIVTFGTKQFVRYSRHVSYWRCPLLGGFTVFWNQVQEQFITSKTEFGMEYKKFYFMICFTGILSNKQILGKSQNCMRTQFSFKFPLKKLIIGTGSRKIRTNRYGMFTWFHNFCQIILHRIVVQQKTRFKAILIYSKECTKETFEKAEIGKVNN